MSAETHADTLAEADDTVALEMLGAVEAHVLQKVSETTLVVILLHRTHFLSDVEECTLLGIFIVLDVVGQTIGQRIFDDSCVKGQLLHVLGRE